MSAYCASKAAVISLTRSLAIELPPNNVRANCICPTMMDTPIIPAELKGALTPMVKDHQVMKRIVLPEEVADSVLFLSSPKSSAITGIALDVDAGFLLK